MIKHAAWLVAMPHAQQPSAHITMHHTGPIAGIACRDNLTATAGYDNRVILWDTATHTALAEATHDHLVNHCAFSPDGKWLVSAGSDYTARVWELPSLTLHTVLRDHADDVDMAVFSPDGQRIATCALDRYVRVFDLQGHCIHTMAGHTGNVLSLEWNADGRHLVSSSVDGTLRTWDTQTGQPVRVHDLCVRTDSVEISTDGWVFAGDDKGRIAVIAGDSVRYVQAHRAGVKKVVLDERQGIVVSLSYDRSMAIWRMQTDQPVPLLEIGRSTLPASIWARGAAVLPDGRIACATFGTTYATYDLHSQTWDVRGVQAGAAINAVLESGGDIYTVGDAGTVRRNAHHHASMGSLCNFLVACGDSLFTGGQLGTLFDAHTGTALYEHHSPLNCATAFTHNGQHHFAVGTYTGDILVFRMEPSGTDSAPVVRHVMTIPVYENAIKGLSYQDGLLFSVCASTAIAWHRVVDWTLVQRKDRAHERIANACCALGSNRFASVGRDRKLRLWDGESECAFVSPHPNSVKCMGVDARRTKILTGSYGGTLAVFDVINQCWESFSRPTRAGISSISWSPKDACFVAASYDGQLYPVAV